MAHSIGYHSKAIVNHEKKSPRANLLALLLHNIGLGTTLAHLALIMLIAVLLLLLTITRNSSTHRAKSTLSAVLDTLTPVLELALSLLLLASGVLLSTSAAEVLVANDVADGLLGRTESLVPLACWAVLVVLGDSAGVGVGGDGA